MKISELISLLEKSKEEYGDIRVGTYDIYHDRVRDFTAVALVWDEEEANAYLDIA